MVHNYEAPTKGKKLSIEFIDRVATEVPKSTKPSQKIWEKSQGKFLREMYSEDNETDEVVSFEDLPHYVRILTTFEVAFNKFAEKIRQSYQKQGRLFSSIEFI